MNQPGLQRTLLLICLLVTGGLLKAQNLTRHEFTVQQAIDYARKNNAQVKNALLSVQIQKQSNRGVTAAALPNISGTVGLTDYIDIPTSLIPGEIFGQPAGTYIPVKFGT